MAYRFEKSESIPEGVRRVVDEQLDWAARQLSKADDPVTAIHEARKSIKKVRGALRLLRPGLGAAYRAETSYFRGLGRKLSELRDAAAIIEVFDQLREKHKARSKHSDFHDIRSGLERDKRDTEEAANVETTIKETIAGLRAAKRRVENWPIPNGGFETIAPGLKASYRRGRRAGRRARKQPAAENFHDFRKRVKEHWYHMRLLEALWTEALKERERDLNNLETWLGDDHNLTVLREKITGKPASYGDDRHQQAFLSAASEEQKELQSKALALGQRLYEEKPRAFAAELAELWQSWQAAPPVKRTPAKAAGRRTVIKKEKGAAA